MPEQWIAPPLPTEPVELFIGILSATSHFAERMAVRKSWMMYTRKSTSIIPRFFVALNGKNEVNTKLKNEAEVFRDIVIVPFIDSYDLVVLKTVAIAEYERWYQTPGDNIRYHTISDVAENDLVLLKQNFPLLDLGHYMSSVIHLSSHLTTLEIEFSVFWNSMESICRC